VEPLVPKPVAAPTPQMPVPRVLESHAKESTEVEQVNWLFAAFRGFCGFYVVDLIGSSGRIRTYNPSVNSYPTSSKHGGY
jgi:hypothetical protein